MERPLISIGIPTYNRPKGLKKTIERIFNQTIKDIEIIISDNHSTNDAEYYKVISSFRDDKNRIKYFRQTSNIGVNRNFQFVLEQAIGKYFIWASDDDEIISDRLIEELMENVEAANAQLAFPNFKMDRTEEKFLEKVYSNCSNKESYLVAWCKNGVGFPMYGLYDREYLINNRYPALLNSKYYFIDSIFLNKLFIEAKTKFVQNVFIYYEKSNSPYSISNFFFIKSYIRRMLISYKMFALADLKLTVKIHSLWLLIKKDIPYLCKTCLNFLIKRIFKFMGLRLYKTEKGGIKIGII